MVAFRDQMRNRNNVFLSTAAIRKSCSQSKQVWGLVCLTCWPTRVTLFRTTFCQCFQVAFLSHEFHPLLTQPFIHENVETGPRTTEDGREGERVSEKKKEEERGFEGEKWEGQGRKETEAPTRTLEEKKRKEKNESGTFFSVPFTQDFWDKILEWPFFSFEISRYK